MPDPSGESVYEAPRQRGEPIDVWSCRHGWQPGTVRQTLRRWLRVDRSPHGGIAWAVMACLREDLGGEIVPPVDRRP